jgi:hypothetical protein
MALKVLSADQVDEFMEVGYTMLRGAFSREVAAAVRKAVLEKAGASEEDPATWTKRRNHLAAAYWGAPFEEACTERFYAGLDDLMGEGRYHRLTDLGWWPILFPGFDEKPWRALVDEWHIDGGFFHHHLDSPEQGMLPLFIFSDIGPGDGGTAIRPGSHKTAARVLKEAGAAGLSQAALGKLVKEQTADVAAVEVNGAAGDIALVHPFMLHTVSTNTGKRVRIVCNPHMTFKERMNVTGEAGREMSVVEESIFRAVEGVKQ